MAWRNCQQAITATIPQLMLTDENADAFMQALIAAGSNTAAKTAAYNTYIKPILINTYCQTNDLVSEKIAGDTTNYINCAIDSGFANFYFYYNNTQQTRPVLSQSKMNNWVCGYVALVDDTNQVGFWQGFTVFITNPLNVGSFGGTQPVYSGESANQVYTILTANEYHQYTWSSVPAISGKNGILSLTEILNINDGNTVNDVALSGNISLSSSSRISAIISGIIQNEGSATVKYSVPSNIYSYIKLVYKQDKIPTSVNDGTAVDLDPTATSIDVMGFSKTVGTKYYLVIFTDKSTSDEYSYEVGNPPPRFSIPKKFVSDNGTFNYNIPSWIEDRVLSVLRTDPSTTTIYFDVENYPEVANLYSHQFVEYPLQFRTYYGTYPETGSRHATSSYIAKDYKLEWLWTSGSAYRDETDYLKTNGEWVSVYTQGSGRSRADSNFESFVAEMFILDHIEKKGYPAYFSWAHSENWSGRKYQCQISKMGTNSRYADLATAIYNALK